MGGSIRPVGDGAMEALRLFGVKGDRAHKAAKGLDQNFRTDSLSLGGMAKKYAGVDIKDSAILSARGKLTDSLSGILTERPPQVSGDIDGDGRLTRNDAKALMDYLFQEGSTPIGLGNADVNADGAIDVSDVVKLSSMITAAEKNLPE